MSHHKDTAGENGVIVVICHIAGTQKKIWIQCFPSTLWSLSCFQTCVYEKNEKFVMIRTRCLKFRNICFFDLDMCISRSQENSIENYFEATDTRQVYRLAGKLKCLYVFENVFIYYWLWTASVVNLRFLISASCAQPVFSTTHTKQSVTHTFLT